MTAVFALLGAPRLISPSSSRVSRIDAITCAFHSALLKTHLGFHRRALAFRPVQGVPPATWRCARPLYGFVLFRGGHVTLLERIKCFVFQIELPEWIAIVAAVAACSAAWDAARSRRLLARSHALAVAAHDRNEPDLDVYLSDSSVFPMPSEQRRVYVFRLVIANKSLAVNSIKQLTLFLESGQADAPAPNVLCPHDSSVFGLIGVPPTDVFTVPRLLAPGEAISGVALFPIADSLLDYCAVESHTVMVTDAHDQQVHCQAILLKESSHASS